MSEATTLIVESIIKREGGTFATTSDNTEYHFSPDTKDRHVAVIANPEHAQEFLRISEGYRLVGSAPVAAPVDAAPVGAVFASARPVEPVQPGTKALGEAPAAPVMDNRASTALEYLLIEDLRAVFKAEIGREPSHRAKAETLIAQIEAHREETASLA